MTRRAPHAAVAFAVALVALAADQAVKRALLPTLGLVPGEPRPLFGPLRLTLVGNNGISYGLFQSGGDAIRWGLCAFSAAVIVGLAAWALRLERRVTAIAVGLIMGGAAGNLADRVTLGRVVDFIDAGALRFPWIFNLADSVITVGVGLLVLEGLLPGRPTSP